MFLPWRLPCDNLTACHSHNSSFGIKFHQEDSRTPSPRMLTLKLTKIRHGDKSSSSHSDMPSILRPTVFPICYSYILKWRISRALKISSAFTALEGSPWFKPYWELFDSNIAHIFIYRRLIYKISVTFMFALFLHQPTWKICDLYTFGKILLWMIGNKFVYIKERRWERW